MKVHMKTPSLVTLGAIIVVTVCSAQEMTLREMAARASGPIIKAIGTEEPSRSMESLAADASLIAQGTVRPLKTYLSEDATLIYTDFEFTRQTVIAGGRGAPQMTPGPAEPLIVRQVGGKTEIGGIQVTVVDEHLNLLPSGEPLVLFLEKLEKEAKYRIAGEHWGAFVVKSGLVVPLVKPADTYRSYAGMRLAQFSQEVTRLRAVRP